MLPGDRLLNAMMQKDERGKAKWSSSMTVPVTFDGGPLHGQVGNVADLPQVQIFFNQKDRLVYMYTRKDELQYVYDSASSKALSDKYDESFAKFGQTGKSVQSWGKKKIPHAET